MTPYDEYQYITFERSADGVLTVTLNRPEALNATDEMLHRELSWVFADIARDKVTRAVVLTGAGKAFCAGGDLKHGLEIEEFLYQHPAISEVQVFGVPDEKMGEEVCAWIQLNLGHEISADDVKAFCQDKITHFKIPRHIDFVDEYPMTVTGKIQKFVMRETMVERLGGS